MPSGLAIGALIGTCFGLGWAVAGVQGIPTRWRAVAFSLSIFASALLAVGVLWCFRSSPSAGGSNAFDGRIYGWAVTLQSLAIVITAVTLRRSAHIEYIMPAVAFIVGLHFFGLARAMVSGGGRACFHLRWRADVYLSNHRRLRSCTFHFLVSAEHGRHRI
jgi:hypothetical protein